MNIFTKIYTTRSVELLIIKLRFFFFLSLLVPYTIYKLQRRHLGQGRYHLRISVGKWITPFVKFINLKQKHEYQSTKDLNLKIKTTYVLHIAVYTYNFLLLKYLFYPLSITKSNVSPLPFPRCLRRDHYLLTNTKHTLILSLCLSESWR